jgi:RimJ/RimL family protein N-acetyltransferase
MRTARLELRPAVESDRSQLVELWMNDDFMVFSEGVRNEVEAHERFDRMLSVAARFPFAKQPVIDPESQQILGYSGIDTFHYEGRERLEYGYRLDVPARGRGLATEAANAILALVDSMADDLDPMWNREVYALVDPTNLASQRVAEKAGFTFWRHDFVEGFHDDLLVRPLGPSPA